MPSESFFLAYDANCGPCSMFKRVVSLFDARRRIEFLSLERAEDSGLLDALAPCLRYASFHLVSPPRAAETRVQSGSKALLPLLRLVSPSKAISEVVERAPGAETALALAYSALSRTHRGCRIAPGAMRPGVNR